MDRRILTNPYLHQMDKYVGIGPNEEIKLNLKLGMSIKELGILVSNGKGGEIQLNCMNNGYTETIKVPLPQRWNEKAPSVISDYFVDGFNRHFDELGLNIQVK